MRIGIQTWGSNGDIRPFIALAGGLSSAGHDVTLVYTSVDNKDYSSFAEKLKFSAIRTSDKLEVAPEKINMLSHKVLNEGNPVKQLSFIMKDFFVPAVDEMYAASQKLCRENDIVIGHWVVHTLQAAAEKSRTPYVSVLLNHGGIPSCYSVPVGLPNLGKWLNPLWWKLADMILVSEFNPIINSLRAKEGLPVSNKFLGVSWESKELNLIAVSPSLCLRQPDWKDHYHVCGFFQMRESAEEWHMPERLDKFIKNGPPPVYMTFGSMMFHNSDAQRESVGIMTEAVKQAQCRAIIQVSLDDWASLPEDQDIFYLSTVPHDRIFPFCSTVVHHGGAGTTHSATRAGCPSVVVAHVTDQVFWGAELKKTGAASRVLQRRSLNSKKLAREIRTVTDSAQIKQKAAMLAKAMKNEDGVGKAVQLVRERYGMG